MKKYNIIYADPPWSYNDKMSGHSFSLDHEYITQSKKWIGELPVSKIADIDCVLFIWATSPLLPEALQVIKDWGFKFKTVGFWWNKVSSKGNQLYNLGRWTMASGEMCIIAVRGKPKRICKNIKQLVIAERTRHSEKPQEVRDRIVELMGDLPRIELFARQKTEGWDVWGNEVESDVDLA